MPDDATLNEEQAIGITERAARRIATLVEQEQADGLMLRITVSGGSITFNVKGNSAGIYVLDGPGKIGTDGVFLR